MSEELIRGKEVVVRFEAQRCIHSRHCVLDRPDVFVPNRAQLPLGGHSLRGGGWNGAGIRPQRQYH
jgi:Divergent 4Fe-4S mono-cluster